MQRSSRRPRVAFLAALLALVATAAASGGSSGSQRNQRYCEIIPSVTKGDTTTTYVYNTQGLNLCPAAQWDALTEDEVNQEYGSQSAKLNGPRYWMFDQVSASGASTSGKTFTFGGIEASLRATIVTPAGAPTVGDQFYVPNTVQRQTVYTFNKGKPFYELIDPNRKVYVMQSYAQIYDKKLMINQLPALGRVLKLPTGWHYRSKVAAYPIQLIATGVAYVVNDNLANAYQQMNKPTLKLDGIPSQCVSQAFTVSVQVGGDTAETRLRVGAKTLKRTTSTTFTVTVPVTRAAKSQRLSIAAVASNDAGSARVSKNFQVCAK